MQCTRSTNFKLYVRKDAYRKPQSTRNETPRMHIRNRTQCTRTGNLTIFVRKRCSGNLTLFIYTVRVQETSRYMYTRYAYRKPHVIRTQGTRTGNLIRTQGTRSGRLTLYVHKVGIDETHVIHTQSTRTGSFMLFVH